MFMHIRITQARNTMEINQYLEVHLEERSPNSKAVSTFKNQGRLHVEEKVREGMKTFL